MVRFVSLFGLAFVTFAALALVSNPRKKADTPISSQDTHDENNAQPARINLAALPSYYAQFSLN